MGLQQDIERLSNKAALEGIRHDLLATAHKLRYPLAAILAKVPGETLAERARMIGVSRQTMYVWAQERFRPGKEPAAVISKLTGIPVDQITELQEGKYDGDGGADEPAGEAPARLAKTPRYLSSGATRLRAKRMRMGAKQRKRGHD